MATQIELEWSSEVLLLNVFIALLWIVFGIFIHYFRDVIESSEKVSVILESWKLKYGDEATVVRLVSGIQMMDLQEVVDEFYREFQIPRKVKAKKQKSE